MSRRGSRRGNRGKGWNSGFSGGFSNLSNRPGTFLGSPRFGQKARGSGLAAGGYPAQGSPAQRQNYNQRFPRQGMATGGYSRRRPLMG